jgi:hypothetical protein
MCGRLGRWFVRVLVEPPLGGTPLPRQLPCGQGAPAAVAAAIQSGPAGRLGGARRRYRP